MKMLFNITCYNSKKPTGIERFAFHIAREVTKAYPETIVVSSVDIPRIPNALVSQFLKCSRLLLCKFEYLSRVVWDQAWLRLLITQYKPNILFFPIQDGMFFPPVKQVVTVHDLHYLHFDTTLQECRQEIHSIRKSYFHLKMPHILEHSAAIIAVSESTKQDIVKTFGTDPAKIHVVNNGYDEERFRIIDEPQPSLDLYELQAGQYVLFVGSILKHKNIIRLVEAFSSVETDLKLVIAGYCKDASYLSEILKATAELGLSADRFQYIEFVAEDDLPSLYAGARVFVLPSLHEGFGVPIIEAMACGTPVITSNCSAMPEVAGDAALLVDPYSVESIASAMREVLENTELLKTLRAAGLERVKAFRWSYSAQKLYDLCKIVSSS